MNIYDFIVSQRIKRATIRLCKPKRQYLFTCEVSRYCLLALHGSIVRTIVDIFQKD